MQRDTGRLLPDWLARCARQAPDQLALRCAGEDWSFARYDEEVTLLAYRLAAAGVNAGDRVALLAQNGLPFATTVFALTRLGAILVPLNTRLSGEEITWQMRDARVGWLLYDAHWAESAIAAGTATGVRRGALEPVPGDDGVDLSAVAPIAVELRTMIDLQSTQAIIYTSGTTGRPKGAVITYGMQWWNAIGSALNLGHDPADRWLACLPFFHIGGLSILMRGVINRIGVIIAPRFDPHSVNVMIQEDGVTIISAVTVMLQRMFTDLGSGMTYPPHLRCVLLGGGPAPLALLEDCAARGIPVVQTYGLTESCSQAVTLAPQEAIRRLGSAGQPLLPVELAIRQDGQAAPPGTDGEIWLRGPTITPGYTGNPEATALAFDRDGWFATGDLGRMDAAGYLYVLDRRSDLIISGGENVYPAEIESALLTHPAVAEAGVCGIADPQWGQRAVAFVTLCAGMHANPTEIRDHVAGRIAHYKVPDAVHIVASLPRNGAGKLLRRELPNLLQS